tara:strand:- start:2277 stop:2507 length:231 start_codon:yes stop_codon:yes gene_type:complete
MKKVLRFLKVITVLNLAVFIPVYAVGLLMNQVDLYWFMNEFKDLQSGQIQLVAVILILIEVMFTGVVLKGEKIIEI